MPPFPPPSPFFLCFFIFENTCQGRPAARPAACSRACAALRSLNAPPPSSEPNSCPCPLPPRAGTPSACRRRAPRSTKSSARSRPPRSPSTTSSGSPTARTCSPSRCACTRRRRCSSGARWRTTSGRRAAPASLSRRAARRAPPFASARTRDEALSTRTQPSIEPPLLYPKCLPLPLPLPPAPPSQPLLPFPSSGGQGLRPLHLALQHGPLAAGAHAA